MSGEKAPLSMLEAAFRAGERFGVPVVLLAVMIWFLRDAAVTLHSTVLVPIVTSHTEFLESTRDTLGEISTTQSQQAKTMQELAVGQQAIVAAQSEIKHAIVRPRGTGQEQN
jgi:hypothetical protein